MADGFIPFDEPSGGQASSGFIPFDSKPSKDGFIAFDEPSTLHDAASPGMPPPARPVSVKPSAMPTAQKTIEAIRSFRESGLIQPPPLAPMDAQGYPVMPDQQPGPMQLAPVDATGGMRQSVPPQAAMPVEAPMFGGVVTPTTMVPAGTEMARGRAEFGMKYADLYEPGYKFVEPTEFGERVVQMPNGERVVLGKGDGVPSLDDQRTKMLVEDMIEQAVSKKDEADRKAYAEQHGSEKPLEPAEGRTGPEPYRGVVYRPDEWKARRKQLDEQEAQAEADRQARVANMSTLEKTGQAVGQAVETFAEAPRKMAQGAAVSVAGIADNIERATGLPVSNPDYDPSQDMMVQSFRPGIGEDNRWKIAEDLKGSGWELGGQVAGDLAAFMVTGGVAKGDAAQMLTAALTGAGVSAGYAYDEAKEFGADEDAARQVALLNGVAGLSEGVPAGRILSRFKGVSGVINRLDDAAARSLWKSILTEGGKGVLEEGGQEVFQQLAGNQIAKAFYDENREWADGLLESGSIGGGIGFMFSALATAYGGVRGRRAANQYAKENGYDNYKAMVAAYEPGAEGELRQRLPEGNPDLMKNMAEPAEEAVRGRKGDLKDRLQPLDLGEGAAPDPRATMDSLTEKLTEKGYSEDQIAEMTPEQVDEALAETEEQATPPAKPESSAAQETVDTAPSDTAQQPVGEAGPVTPPAEPEGEAGGDSTIRKSRTVRATGKDSLQVDTDMTPRSAPAMAGRGEAQESPVSIPEPWQMTNAAFGEVDFWNRPTTQDWNAVTRDIMQKGPSDLDPTHKRAVRRAIESGKPVPDSVLADYPDLQKQSTSGAPVTTPVDSGQLRSGPVESGQNQPNQAKNSGQVRSSPVAFTPGQRVTYTDRYGEQYGKVLRKTRNVAGEVYVVKNDDGGQSRVKPSDMRAADVPRDTSASPAKARTYTVKEIDDTLDTAMRDSGMDVAREYENAINQHMADSSNATLEGSGGFAVSPDTYNELTPKEKRAARRAGVNISEDAATEIMEAVGDKLYEMKLAEVTGRKSAILDSFIDDVLEGASEGKSKYPAEVTLAAYMKRLHEGLKADGNRKPRTEMVDPKGLPAGTTLTIMGEEFTVEQRGGNKVLADGIELDAADVGSVPADKGSVEKPGDKSVQSNKETTDERRNDGTLRDRQAGRGDDTGAGAETRQSHAQRLEAVDHEGLVERYPDSEVRRQRNGYRVTHPNGLTITYTRVSPEMLSQEAARNPRNAAESIVESWAGRTVTLGDGTEFVIPNTREELQGSPKLVAVLRTLAPSGAYQGNGRVLLNSSTSTLATAEEESFHAAYREALTDGERAAIDAEFGNDERAYHQWYKENADSSGAVVDSDSDAVRVMKAIRDGRVWTTEAPSASTSSEVRFSSEGQGSLYGGMPMTGEQGKMFDGKSEQKAADFDRTRDVTEPAPYEKDSDAEAKKRQRKLDEDRETGTLFSYYSPQGDGSDMVVVHNLSQDNLAFIDEMGGEIAMPSVAIARVDTPLTGFGEVTLIAPKSLADPRGSKKTRVYDADAYSPRYPTATYKVTRDFDQRFAPIEKWARETYGDLQSESLKSEDYHIRSILYGPDGHLDVLEFASRGSVEMRRDLGLMAYYASTELGKTFKGTDNYEVASELRKLIEQNQDKFNSWVRQLFRGVTERKLFKGFTNAGYRRYQPYTIENVMKEMRRMAREEGGEGFHYGAGSVRSKVAKRFKSITEIQKDRERLVAEKDMESSKEDFNKRMSDIAYGAASAYRFTPQFGFSETFWNAVLESGMGRRAPVLDEYGFDREAMPWDEINTFLDDLKNAPTQYFEGKLDRIVSLREFSGAVVPDNVTDETIAVLEKNGITSVERYKRNDDKSRSDAIDSLTKSMDDGGDVRFSYAQPAETEFKGKRIATGVPVSLPYVHNTQSATDIYGVPKKDAPFDRGYEPSGKYAIISDYDNGQPGFETGVLDLTNPLVIKGGEYGTDTSWKRALSKDYGGKRGKRLSSALIGDGYDAVITVGDRGEPSEILDLTSFDESIARFSYDASDPLFIRQKLDDMLNEDLRRALKILGLRQEARRVDMISAIEKAIQKANPLAIDRIVELQNAVDAERERARRKVIRMRERYEKKRVELSYIRDALRKEVVDKLPTSERGKFIGRISQDNLTDTSAVKILDEIEEALRTYEWKQARDRFRDTMRRMKTGTRQKGKQLRPEFIGVVKKAKDDIDPFTMSSKTRRQLKALAEFVEKNPDHTIPPEVLKDLKRLHNRDSALPGSGIEQMTADEINAVVDAIEQAEHLSDLKNSLIAGQRKRKKDAVVATIVDEASAKPLLPDEPKGAMIANRLRRFLRRPLKDAEANRTAPARFFGEGATRPEQMMLEVSPMLAETIYTPFRKGIAVEQGFNQDVWDSIQTAMSATEKPMGKTATERWRRERVTLNTENGPKEITRAERIWLAVQYMAPDNRKRMLRDGIVLRRIMRRRIDMTAEQFDAMNNEMDATEIAVAQEMFGQFNGYFKQRGNAAWVEVYGVTKFDEPMYAPIAVDRTKQQTGIGDSLMSSNDMTGRALEGWGNLKERVGSSTPIEIDDAFDQFFGHANMMGKIVAYLKPYRDARIILGDPKVKETINERYGYDMLRSFETRLNQQAVGFASSGRLGAIPRALMRMGGRGILGFRLTTVAIQPAGLAISTAYYDSPTRIMAAMGKAPKFKDTDKIARKYSPIWRDRYDHYFNQVTSGVLGERNSRSLAGPDIGLIGLKPIEKVDQWMGVIRWHAAEAQVRDTQPNLKSDSPEFYREVADLFERVLLASENTSYALEMTGALAKGRENPWWGMFVMFGSAPSKIYSTARMGVHKLRTGDTRSGLYAIAAVALSTAWVVAIRQLTGDDEEDKQRSIAGDAARELAGTVPFFGDAMSSAIRFVETGGKQAWPVGDTILQDAIESTGSVMGSTYRAADAWVNEQVDAEGNLVAEEKTWQAVESIVRAIKYIGIPAESVMQWKETGDRVLNKLGITSESEDILKQAYADEEKSDVDATQELYRMRRAVMLGDAELMSESVRAYRDAYPKATISQLRGRVVDSRYSEWIKLSRDSGRMSKLSEESREHVRDKVAERYEMRANFNAMIRRAWWDAQK